jgi:hypothetical protein
MLPALSASIHVPASQMICNGFLLPAVIAGVFLLIHFIDQGVRHGR